MRSYNVRNRAYLKGMNEAKIISILQPFYREILEDPNLVLTRELNANDVDSWDSLNHILLIVKCEEVLNIKFQAEELADLVDFGEFIDLILRKN